MEKRRALVLEDDPSIRNELIRELAVLELTVDGCDTARQAVEAIESQTYAVVLIDSGLREGSGYEVLEYLHRKTGPVPGAVVCSSSMDIELRSRCFRLGAADFISKPYQPQEVVRRVQRVLDGYAAPTHRIFESLGDEQERDDGKRRWLDLLPFRRLRR